MTKNPSSLSRYLISLTIVLVAFIVYSRTIAPMIDGKGPGRAAVPPGPRTTDRFDPKVYFPEGSWERGQCKILRTKQGYLLFKEYQPYDDGSVDVYPVSMVVPSSAMDGMTAGDAPIILNAPDGARLQFDRRVTIAGGFGKFQHGQLNGKIRIVRNDSELKLKDRFEVLTSNVELQREKVVARSAVTFQFGAHRGKGRNLVIELAPPGPSRKNRNQDRFSQIRLNQVDELIIDNLESTTARELPSHPATTSNFVRRNDLNGGRGFDSARFRVTCDGPLIYTAHNDTLTLNKNVVAARLDIPGDTLRCEGLRLVFVKDTRPSGPDIEAEAEKKQASRIRRMVVIGKPATIDFKSRETFLQAATIDFDVSSSIANLVGPDLYLKQKNFEFSGRSLKYHVTEDGSIGNTIANGPGKLTQFPAQQASQPGANRSFSAEFAGKLVIQPDQQRKVISLRERAHVVVNQETELFANELHFWIQETKIDTHELQSRKWKWDPARMVAEGNVEIRSPKIQGTTRSLVANWKPPARGSSSRPSATGRPGTPAALQGPARSPSGLPVSHSGQTSKKIFFEGESVDLKMDASGQFASATANKRNSIEQLTIRENVRISDQPIDRSRMASKNGKALEIRGDEVKLLPSENSKSRDQYKVEIRTSRGLASFAARGVLIQGNPILYDQFAGRAWVQGKGRIDLETQRSTNDRGNGQLLSATTTGSPNFPGLQETTGKTQQVVQIDWDGGMVFDGRQIYFEHQVEAQVTRTDPVDRTKTISSAKASALTLVLDRDVDLKNPGQNRRSESPKVEKMILANIRLLDKNTAVFKSFWSKDRPLDSLSMQDPRVVEVRNQTVDAAGNLQSVQVVNVPSAIAFGFTGDIQARGPGNIRVWHHAKSNSPFQNASQTAGGTKSLTFTQVNFENTLRGNSKDKSLTLDGKIRSIHSPVDSWEATWDPTRPGNAPSSAVAMECDQLQMNQWRPQSRVKEQIELVASGNTIVSSQLFRATGNQVRYNQGGEQVIIEGSSPHYAQLTHRRDLQSTPSVAVAGKFTYYLRSKTYQAENLKSAEATHGGGVPNR